MQVTARLEGFPERWESGKQVMNATLALGQGRNGTTVRLELADPGGEIASRITAHMLKAGGIIGVPQQLSPPSAPGAALADSAPSDGSIPTEAAIIRKAFELGVTDPAQVSYILATAKHETDNFATLIEYADGSQYEGRADLGNTQPGDGRRFKGRGYVQLTGRANFRYYSNHLGIDLLGSPERAAEPEIALYTLVHGMMNGVYTGVSLPQYVSGTRQDFYQARRVVNALDDAELIAGYAREYLVRFDELAASANAVSGSTQATFAPSPASAPTGQVIKGNRLHIEVGDRLFSFYHTGTETDHSGRTVLTGQGVRWVMGRRRKTRSFEETALSAIAATVADDNGLALDYRASHDPAIEHLEQNGESDLDMLMREADEAGLFVLEEGGALVIDSLDHTHDTRLVLAIGRNILTWSIADRAVSQLADIETEAPSALLQDEGKADIDPLTGQLHQTTPERADSQALTGATSTRASASTTPESQAVSQQLRARTKRVKGLPSKFAIPLDETSLGLRPLSAIRTEGLAATFSRVWLIDAVTHDVLAGTTTLSVYSPVEALDLSPPAPAIAAGSGEVVQGSPSAQGWIWPITGVVTSPPGMRRGRPHNGIDIAAQGDPSIYAAKAGTVSLTVAHCPPFTPQDGCGDGYGNWVQLKHADGSESRYAHLSTVAVSDGQQVQQGQKLGEQGNSGGSRGAHLHFEIRLPGGGIIYDFSEVGLTGGSVGNTVRP